MFPSRSATPAQPSTSRNTRFGYSQPGLVAATPMTAPWTMTPMGVPNNHLFHTYPLVQPLNQQVQHVRRREGLPYLSMPVFSAYSNRPNIFQSRQYTLLPATQIVAPFPPSAISNAGNHRAIGEWSNEQTIAANQQYLSWSAARTHFVLSQPRQYASSYPIVENLHHHIANNHHMASPIQQNVAIANNQASPVDLSRNVPEPAAKGENSTSNSEDEGKDQSEEVLPEWLQDFATPEELEESEHVPYAPLIFMALKDAPNYQARLSEIYTWFRRHTVKHIRTSKTNLGWMNSIRHNLSTNDAFVKIAPTSTEKVKKGCIWRLADSAIATGGISPTTRYRGGARGGSSSSTRSAMPETFLRGARGMVHQHTQNFATQHELNKATQARMRRQRCHPPPHAQGHAIVAQDQLPEPVDGYFGDLSSDGLTASPEHYSMSNHASAGSAPGTINGLLPPIEFSPTPVASAPPQDDELRYPTPSPTQTYPPPPLDPSLVAILAHDRRTLTDPVLIRTHDHLTGERPYSPPPMMQTNLATPTDNLALEATLTQVASYDRRNLTNPVLAHIYDTFDLQNFNTAAATQPAPTEAPAMDPTPANAIVTPPGPSAPANSPTNSNEYIDASLYGVSSLFQTMRDSPFFPHPLAMNPMDMTIVAQVQPETRSLGAVSHHGTIEEIPPTPAAVADPQPATPEPQPTLSATIQGVADLNFDFSAFHAQEEESEAAWMLRLNEFQRDDDEFMFE